MNQTNPSEMHRFKNLSDFNKQDSIVVTRHDAQTVLAEPKDRGQTRNL